jgi:hypothetical protein
MNRVLNRVADAFRGRSIWLIIIGALVYSSSANALGEVVHFKMIGEIAIDFAIGTLPDGIYEGAPFEAHLSYDTNTPEHPLFADDPQRGLYPIEQGPNSFLDFCAGPAEISANGMSLWVANDIDGSPQIGDGRPIWDLPDDSFQMRDSTLTANFPIAPFHSINFRWRDPTRKALSSDHLPTELVLGDFKDPWFEIETGSLNRRESQFTVRGVVHEISRVPEPGGCVIATAIAIFHCAFVLRQQLSPYYL